MALTSLLYTFLYTLYLLRLAGDCDAIDNLKSLFFVKRETRSPGVIKLFFM